MSPVLGSEPLLEPYPPHYWDLAIVITDSAQPAFLAPGSASPQPTPYAGMSWGHSAP